MPNLSIDETISRLEEKVFELLKRYHQIANKKKESTMSFNKDEVKTQIDKHVQWIEQYIQQSQVPSD